MNNLIYYPGFEPENLNWLKYALIHIDRFSPIVPHRGEVQVSDVIKRIKNETELINNVEPSYKDGERATIRVIEHFDKIARRPGLYKSFFGTTDIIREWQSGWNRNTIIYNEKYGQSFDAFCYDNKLGERHGDGLLMSESLASFFMTFLAEEMALRKNANPITDIPNLDDLSSFLRKSENNNEEKLNASRIVINFCMPENIEQIEIERLIEFRNNAGISDLRKSFNQTLESFYDSVEQNFDPFTYLQEIRHQNSEFRNTMIDFLGPVAMTGMSLFLVSEHQTSAEFIHKIAEAGISVFGIHNVSKQWKLNMDRRNARKFLVKLRKI